MFWASNVFAAVLAITPFFAISLYFNNLSTWVLYHASFLFLVILIRDLVKDLQNFKGDWVRIIAQLPLYWIKTTKYILTVLMLLAAGTVFLLLTEEMG